MKSVKEVKPISLELLRKFEPRKLWLSHDSRLHGVDHMARVFILQELICDQLEQQGIAVNRAATRWASSVHDVGRVDDGIDPEHGRRSAAWMNQNVPTGMTPETLDIATYIVHWHVPPDDAAPAMTTELQVLKDADGLDRVRLGDLNESYLRTDAARTLINTAQQLYDLSIMDDKSRSGTFNSVLRAAQNLELVQS